MYFNLKKKSVFDHTRIKFPRKYIKYILDVTDVVTVAAGKDADESSKK